MRRRTALLVGGAFAVALALGGLVGGVLAESRSATPSSAAPVALGDRALAGAAGGIGAAPLAALEAQVRAQPRDAMLLTQLGFAYQLRCRETAEPSYLPRSEAALRRAVRFGVEDANAILGLGSLALIRHEFRAALAYGRRAERLLPDSSRPYGVIGDALVELGRYDDAFAAFDRMVTLRPSLASYARVAYARELVGDRAGAVAAMRLALGAAAGQPEPTAWAHVELARLQLGLGNTSVARSHARSVLRALPGYPSARTELARVAAVSGHLRSAVRQARRAADAVPTSQSIGLLGELLDRAGRASEARRQRATVAVIDRLLEANGVQVDLEFAVSRADNLVRPRETVKDARRARAARPSIYGDDALAWALARAGRCVEAVPLARRALRLGTKDGLLHFHLGYAEGCAGDRSAMRDAYRRASGWRPNANATVGARAESRVLGPLGTGGAPRAAHRIGNACVGTAGYAPSREPSTPTRRPPCRARVVRRRTDTRIMRRRLRFRRNDDDDGDDDDDRHDHDGDDDNHGDDFAAGRPDRDPDRGGERRAEGRHRPRAGEEG
jgi:tetratricopeptide (TPR) repeat protein